MALVVKDRVKETSTITGTGTLTLAGAADNFQSFSVIGDGNTTYYAIVDIANGDWEVGLGTYTASGTTLSRDTVLESSNSGSLVSFAGNTVEVFCTYPAEKGVYLDASGDVTIEGNLTVNGTTTTISAENLAVADNMIYMNDGSTATNPDLGIAGNYNDGTYAHAGFFRDATDGRWKVFDGYTPEPDASTEINTGHASFSLADIQASNFYGNLTGDVTGDVTGNADTATTLATARTITLGGDVSGAANFDGSANITITAAVADDSHNHTIANVDGLQTALDTKLDSSTGLTTSTSFGGDVSGTYNAIVVADDSHNHVISNVDGLQTALDAKLEGNQTITLSGDVSGSGTTAITVTVADDSHNHVISNVDGLQTALDGKQATGDYVVATGDTMTGNLSFGDNVKANFGAGSDLQIYHDGSNSWIRDLGTGDLVISTDGSGIQFKSNGSSEVMMRAYQNDRVDLYYDNAVKLATTSTGINVTGTVAATSYTGDGSALTGISAGATGGGSDSVFWENDQTITTNYTITSGKNAGTFGAITIDSGVSVTVPTGSTWTIV